MAPNSLDGTRATGRSGQRESEPNPFCLDIEIDEEAGSVRVFDPRAFHAGRPAFCRRLLEVAARRPGVSKAEVDLASASCTLEFGPGSVTSQGMASAFVDSVREAATGSPRSDRTPWWRPTTRWLTLTAYPFPGDVSLWETLDVKPGRIRLRPQRLAGGRARLSRLAEALSGLEGVERCRVYPWFRTLAIDFRPGSPVASRLVDTVERALEDLKAAESMRPDLSPHALSAVDGAVTEVATGLKRLKYLALAGGTFALTLVALVVPGIPTVPCLVATSYYLARSSPRLDGMLRRTPLFGPILTEWEQHHALSWSSKGKLIGLTVTLIVVTLVLTPRSPVALVLILVVASLSVYGVARLPVLSEEPRAGIPFGQPVRLALPAP